MYLNLMGKSWLWKKNHENLNKYLGETGTKFGCLYVGLYGSDFCDILYCSFMCDTMTVYRLL